MTQASDAPLSQPMRLQTQRKNNPVIVDRLYSRRSLRIQFEAGSEISRWGLFGPIINNETVASLR